MKNTICIICQFKDILGIKVDEIAKYLDNTEKDWLLNNRVIDISIRKKVAYLYKEISDNKNENKESELYYNKAFGQELGGIYTGDIQAGKANGKGNLELEMEINLKETGKII